jgi:hypothetical protein
MAQKILRPHIGTYRKLLFMTSLTRFRIRVSKAINLEGLIKKDETGRHPQREILSPLEASLDHLLITPPSHFTPQKVRGWVGRFFVNGR